MVGRRSPEGVASRSVGLPAVAGATALGLVVLALLFGHVAMVGSSFALHAIVDLGRVLALLLPGLTDPSWLGV